MKNPVFAISITDVSILFLGIFLIAKMSPNDFPRCTLDRNKESLLPFFDEFYNSPKVSFTSKLVLNTKKKIFSRVTKDAETFGFTNFITPENN